MFNKKARISLVVAGLLGVLLLAGCGAKTDDAKKATEAKDVSLEQVQKAGVLKVGMAPFYAPFESTNEKTKKIEGFDVDLMNAIAAKMGVKASYVPAEWTALLGGLNKGDSDIIVSAMTQKEAAQGNVEFTQPYYNLDDIIIVDKGNPKGIATKKDLKDMVVGVQTGSGAEQIADKIKDEVGIKEVKKYKLTQDGMNDLKAGRIDAVLAGVTFAVEQSKVDPSFEVLTNAPLDSAELVGVVKKGSTSLTSAFNKALDEVKRDGTYDKLVKKWLTIAQ